MQTLTTPDTTQQKLDASFGVALQRLAERHPRQVNILQPTEPDGTDAQPNEPAPMPSPIRSITITRTLRAHRFGISTEVEVYIHRNGRPVAHYEVNPILPERGRISNASVLRAKRAQLALVHPDTDED